MRMIALIIIISLWDIELAIKGKERNKNETRFVVVLLIMFLVCFIFGW